jgi:hypothetical protein
VIGRRLALALAFALAALVAAVAPASADDGDKATLSRGTARIGEQLELLLEVHTPAGATVEVTPGGQAWNGVEVVSVDPPRTRADGAGLVHFIRAVVAPFTPGDSPFAPVVTVVVGSDAVPRVLPVVNLSVRPTLAPGDPLELSPLPPPASIAGAESPLLKPAIVLGIVVGVLIVALALMFAIRAIRHAFRHVEVAPPASAPPPGLGGAESLLHSDPVAAYRVLASLVRVELGKRYGLPAPALTTRELRRRMEDAGLDRWQARLVGGLLEECDAVVYAGYRPAAERREADLNMAREIVEAGA